MTPKEFGDLLDACGGAPEHWPPGARASAERLLDTSNTARKTLRAQQEIDHWLSSSGETGALPDFAARAIRRRQLGAISPARSVLIGMGRSAFAATAALVAIGLGTATGFTHARADEPTQVLAAALSTPGEAPDAP